MTIKDPTNSQVQANLLQLAYRSLPTSQIGMVLAGIVLVFLLKGQVDGTISAIWILLLIVTVVFRLITFQISITKTIQRNISKRYS
jgi:lysylphosphatidylglycerol synthetase-like protein (DUF2156 family)